MLLDFLPGRCSKLNVFLSYASEQRAVAEEIAHALKNAGHGVFFDKDSLKPGSDYNHRIRNEIRASDRFIFLLTRPAIEPGRFTLTELGFAKERWPNAKASVLPVLLDPTLPAQQIPAYLRSVHILPVEGNAAAEIAAAVDGSRRLKPRCAATLAFGAACLALGGSYVATGYAPFSQHVGFKLLRPDQVDFRPMSQPRAATMDWLDSNVAGSIVPVQYSKMSQRPVRIHDEKVELMLQGRSITYKRFNEVEIKPEPCPGDWLCTRKGLGAESIEPGRTLRRDTMFIPASTGTMSWRSFLTHVIDESVSQVDVRLTTSVEVSDWGRASEVTQHIVCRVDLKQLRAQLEAAGFKQSALPPSRLTPFCTN